MLLLWPGVILAWSDGGDDTVEALEGGLGARAEFIRVVMAGGQ